ncbi:class I lanthipeptide [Larkinella knui]
MKKQLSKITLKTDKIISLSKSQASNVIGGQKPTAFGCTTKGYCPAGI